MTDDLVKRLRDRGASDINCLCGNPVCVESADRIEKLEAEVKRLIKSRNKWLIKSRNKWGELYNQTLKKLRLSVMSDSEYVKIIDEKCAEQASRIEKLEAALHDASEFLDNYSDVIDGLDGQPEANDAMILKQEIDRVLENKHD